MNPDIDLRLKSLHKALTDVILPALPEHERLARDQVGLVIGHLAIIGGQWKYALRYELESCAEAAALARELELVVDDAVLIAELNAARARADAVERSDYDAVSAIHRALRSLIDRAINSGGGDAQLPAGVLDAVLAFNARRALRERAWHRGSGLDPDLESLPEIASLFASGSGSG